jgi:DNA-directed RNA polymerase specialized sigma24 family protein
MAISTDFNAFVTERQRPLLRFATALSGDPRLAEEIVADTLSKAWEH